MYVCSYFGKMTSLLEELNTLEPLITCACCALCTADPKHESHRATTRLHEFLMGLFSEYYTQTRSNILSYDPLPSLDRAYRLVIQDERVRLAKPASEALFSVIVARTRGSFDSFDDKGDIIDKSTFYCTHCKKSGHLAKTCFEIIGYQIVGPTNPKFMVLVVANHLFLVVEDADLREPMLL